MWSVITVGRQGTQFSGGGDIQQKGKVEIFGPEGRPPLIPSLSEISWSPLKENPEEGAWSANCNDFEKSEWEYFLSKQQIYSMQG